MIAVDSSVWIAALRKYGNEAAVLEALLDADDVLLPVRCPSHTRPTKPGP